MKKVISIVLLLLALTLPVFATADMFFTLGVQNSKLNLSLGFPESGMSSQFDMQALGEFTSIFNKNYGVKGMFLTDFQSGFQLGASFAYKNNISSDVSYILAIGPTFSFKGASLSEKAKGDFSIGANMDAAFQFYLTSSMYVDVATGLIIDIVSFTKDRSPETSINIFIPLPRVGLGWKF